MGARKNILGVALDKKFSESLLITPMNGDVYTITGLTKSPYSFLQNIQRLKAELHRRGKTFKPVRRLAEGIVVMKIVPLKRRKR